MTANAHFYFPFRRIRHVLAKILCPMILFAASSVLVHAETITISGTGAGLGTMKLLAQTFQMQHPDITVQVFPNTGSTGGIRAALAGAINIGISARALKPDEREHGAVAVAYAKTPFVIATSLANSVSGVTLKDLQTLYSGTTAKWPDGQRVRLIMRPANDSDTDLLKGMSPELDAVVTKALAIPGLATAITDQDSANAIEKIPGAIGTSTLALILSEHRALKALAINGVIPSIQTLKDGSYPYQKTLYFVTTANVSKAAQEFITFVHSARGALIDNGQLPFVDP